MKAAAQPVPVRAGHISPIWRGLWVLAALAALGLFMLSLPFYLRPGPRNLTIDAVPVWIFALEFINSIALMAVALLSLGLAGLLFWRRAGDRMALFVSFFLLGYGTVLVGPLELLHQAHPALVGIDPGLIQRLVLFPSFMALLGLFPDGRFVPGWMRWTVLISLGLTPLYFGLPCCNQTQVNLWLATSVSIAPLIFVPLGGYAQIYRYRWVSTPVERQQTKWVLWGVALFLLLLALSSIPYQWMQSLPAGTVPPMWVVAMGSLYSLAVGVLPLSLAMAVVRSHLWDIDVIVRRTLIYSVLTGLLALAYFGLVLVLQEILRALTGQSRNELVTVISTLAIAALFVPFRSRVQTVIDQRFYRRKYDAASTLVRFGASLRDQTDLAQLSKHLLAVVDDTMQPSHVSLWLRPPGPRQRPA